MEVGDKVMTKVVENCVCGSVHEGDNWTIREWRDEHNAAHAERVIQSQRVVPYTPRYLEPYKVVWGDHYYVPAVSSDTVNSCGMSPFEKQIIADHEERVRVEKQIKDDAEKERLKKNEEEYRKHSRPGDRPVEYL